MFRAVADVLRQIGGAIATLVTAPFRAVGRLFGGASSSARGGRARSSGPAARRVPP
ncbi:LPFR motif small protein [Streptomyces sp. NPDC096012]|uniref:LPFR motif small protein n=1 Tax=Streptomyces sp. NPDC096012 TaxID=3155684 RepID=UPI00336AD4E0